MSTGFGDFEVGDGVHLNLSAVLREFETSNGLIEGFSNVMLLLDMSDFDVSLIHVVIEVAHSYAP